MTYGADPRPRAERGTEWVPRRPAGNGLPGSRCVRPGRGEGGRSVVRVTTCPGLPGTSQVYACVLGPSGLEYQLPCCECFRGNEPVTVSAEPERGQGRVSWDQDFRWEGHWGLREAHPFHICIMGGRVRAVVPLTKMGRRYTRCGPAFGGIPCSSQEPLCSLG